jgi:methyl-accepting chemotaxis protein
MEEARVGRRAYDNELIEVEMLKNNNLKIGVRLLLAFAGLLSLLSAIAYVGWSSLSMDKAHIDVVNEHNVKIALVNVMRGKLDLAARAARNYIISAKSDIKQVQLEKMRVADRDYDVSFDRLGALVRGDRAKQLYAQLKNQRIDVRPLYQKMIALEAAGNDQASSSLLEELVEPSQDRWNNTIQAMVELLEQQNSEAIDEMNRDYAFATTLLGSAVLISLAAGVFMAFAITRSITIPMQEAVKLAQAVAGGDLSSDIQGMGQDETGQLLQALRGMNGNLVGIVRQVRSNTDLIVTAAQQIAIGNQDLSSRAQAQVSSLQETALSLEVLTAIVRQNADCAGQANALTASASDVARKGSAVVSQVVGTMGAINASSRKIADIIGVIDSIAFQTNILALNAAVEAAHAGEEGRGFAVVASEVRSLAQRSAAAAQEIKDLISDSVRQVEAGGKLVELAGVTMEQILAGIEGVSGIMVAITGTSQEQSVGIGKVNEAISQMDQATQQNAALMEETAAAAESMLGQSHNLVQSVSIFRLRDGSPPIPKKSVPRTAVLAQLGGSDQTRHR